MTAEDGSQREWTVNVIKECLLGDFDNDELVTVLDLDILVKDYGTKQADEEFIEKNDLNKDGIIDIYDLVIVSKKLSDEIHLKDLRIDNNTIEGLNQIFLSIMHLMPCPSQKSFKK